MLKCLIAFILGWLLCRMMGDGFSVGGQNTREENMKLWEDAEACGYQKSNILSRGIGNINNICINLSASCTRNDINCRDGLRNKLGTVDIELGKAIGYVGSCVSGDCPIGPTGYCTIGGIGDEDHSSTGIFSNMGDHNCDNNSRDFGLPKAAATKEMCKQLLENV